MLPQGASPSVRRFRSTQSHPTQGTTLQEHQRQGNNNPHIFCRLDDVEEHRGSLEVHADPEERREDEGVFPWGEEVLEDVRDKVRRVI